MDILLIIMCIFAPFCFILLHLYNSPNIGDLRVFKMENGDYVLERYDSGTLGCYWFIKGRGTLEKIKKLKNKIKAKDEKNRKKNTVIETIEC